MSGRDPATRVVVVAPDVADARVRKRLVALADGGAELVVLAFDRGREPAQPLPGDVVRLGRTRSTAYAQRLVALARAVPVVWRHRSKLPGVRHVYAINVDCAALGLVVRALSRGRPGLVFELADVQPVMTRRGARPAVLRAAERLVLRRTSLVVTTSPAYVREYLAKQGWRGPHLLLENRVFPPLPGPFPSTTSAPHTGEPWRIGWFGELRCRRSWDAIRAAAPRLEGRVQFVLAGRPTMPDADRFAAELASTPQVEFRGTYDYPEDLPSLYGSVHLNWCIDLTDTRGNSAWFLPNRLYEGGLFHVPPLALDATELGRWVHDRDIGLLVRADLLTEMLSLPDRLSVDLWTAARARMSALPEQTWQGSEQYAALVTALCRP